jgi:hypothetical protein
MEETKREGDQASAVRRQRADDLQGRMTLGLGQVRLNLAIKHDEGLIGRKGEEMTIQQVPSVQAAAMIFKGH